MRKKNGYWWPPDDHKLAGKSGKFKMADLKIARNSNKKKGNRPLFFYLK